MRPDPKYVIDLAMKLQSAKDAVERLQQDWDNLFPEFPAAVLPPTVNNERVMRSESAISRTLVYINSHSDEEFDASELGDLLGTPVPSTRTNLAKLFADGKIQKVRDGVYRTLKPTGEK
jgi:hypothetical protein